jgi:hypothetical protein
MNDERTKELEESFRQSERVRQEILRGYKHGPTTPDNHAYEMATLGDESMMGHEARILENDKSFAKRQSVYRVRDHPANQRDLVWPAKTGRSVREISTD